MTDLAVRVGVDIGGTFTDIVLLVDDGRIVTHKLLTTPEGFGEAVVTGVRLLLEQLGADARAVTEIVHGTTIATNIIVEHKGAPTGLLTTTGFRDVLELRRIRSPELYNLFYVKPPPLVRRRYRLEVDGRIDSAGREARPLDLDSAERALQRFAAEGITSVAVCFINSFANPSHEQAVGRYITERFPTFEVSLSSDVLPEIREYERTSTTVINAYLRPVVRTYLTSLIDDFRRADVLAPLLVMQSNGGVMTAPAAQHRPIHIVESGPAAGVIASVFMTRKLGVQNALTFDMGGTTAKASIIENGAISQTPEYEVGGGMSLASRLVKGGGYALRTPVIDIAEVGAGGGSIVWVDRGGSLQVGPRSAGAVPGPVCYLRGGDEPTVSDANVALGYLNPDYLVGGELAVDAEAARRAMNDRVAAPMGLSLEQAAYGVHLVANSNMTRAVRAVSSQRGRDPRGFTLIAFGGSGPVHAVEMARGLEIPRVLVPRSPGLFSAFGLLFADVEHHSVRTFFRRTRNINLAELNAVLAEMEAEARTTLAGEGYDSDHVTLRRQADLRYAGQSFELTVPLHEGDLDSSAIDGLRTAFAAEHERTYGHRSDDDAPIDLISLRLVAAGIPERSRVPSDDRLRAGTDTGRPRLAAGSRQAYFGEAGTLETPVLGRPDLTVDRIHGPLIVEEYDATTVVPPGWSARVDEWGNILVAAG